MTDNLRCFARVFPLNYKVHSVPTPVVAFPAAAVVDTLSADVAAALLESVVRPAALALALALALEAAAAAVVAAAAAEALLAADTLHCSADTPE